MTSKWRTPEDAQPPAGLIGPNAILQMVPVLHQVLGPARSKEILANAGIVELPDGKSMIPEKSAARLHRQVRWEEPILAPFIAKRAGVATANYILKHRIPKPAQMMLKVLPIGPSSRFLSQAIARHAWTFAGSGQFRVIDPMTFEVSGNPLIHGEASEHCMCHWHAAVFARLYDALVARGLICTETACMAQHSSPVCRFELGFENTPPVQNMIEIKEQHADTV